MFFRIKNFFLFCFFCITSGCILLSFYIFITYPKLPDVRSLDAYRPSTPLQIFDRNGNLITKIGVEKRIYISEKETPPLLVNAIISAEDENFFNHFGIDFLGIIRATIANISSGSIVQGASTITQQVARNFFLSNKKSFMRKINEILLAIKIDKTLEKSKIMNLYINQIYLGQRSFGFASASETYFGKSLNDLNLAEIAMLAGLPKAPSRNNPVNNFSKSKNRQLYVLKRLLKLNYIDPLDFEIAKSSPIVINNKIGNNKTIGSEHFTEHVRQLIYKIKGEAAYKNGYKVFTTLSSDFQDYGYMALRNGLINYSNNDKEMPFIIKNYTNVNFSDTNKLIEILDPFPVSDDLLPSIITNVDENNIEFYSSKTDLVQVSKSLMLSENFTEEDMSTLAKGGIVYIRFTEKSISFIKFPKVQGALVSIDPNNGEVLSMVGSFDYYLKQFNHVTQSNRQPGSSFKPFVYSAALEKGFSPSTLINDAPIAVNQINTGEEIWDPKNFRDDYVGLISMRDALVKSKNLVSIRVIQAIGAKYAQNYIQKFGFLKKNHPPYLTMALGAGTVSPMDLALGYSVFANKGFKIKPKYIKKIEDFKGNTIYSDKNSYLKKERVITERNAFVMFNMLQDVIRVGTGRGAQKIGRIDLAGKTGTTNEQRDAWFSGFQPNLVTVVWVGFDTPKSLGTNQTGSSLALPIWINFMENALKNYREELIVAPNNIKAVAINSKNLITGKAENKIDYFFAENVPIETNNEILKDSPEDIFYEIY